MSKLLHIRKWLGWGSYRVDVENLIKNKMKSKAKAKSFNLDKNENVFGLGSYEEIGKKSFTAKRNENVRRISFCVNVQCKHVSCVFFCKSFLSLKFRFAVFPIKNQSYNENSQQAFEVVMLCYQNFMTNTIANVAQFHIQYRNIGRLMKRLSFNKLKCIWRRWSNLNFTHFNLFVIHDTIRQLW